MAKLVDVHITEKEPVMKRRQLPLTIYENLTIIMDLNSSGLICDNPQVKGRELEAFMRKYRILSSDELRAALRLEASEIFNVLNQSIPCVGCRRSAERLYYQLCKSGHPTLDPLVLSSDEILTVKEEKIMHPQSLASLLNGHSTGIEWLVENQPRWKKSQRCTFHSLESGATRCGRAAWRVAWDAMRAPAREHVTLIDFDTIQETLHTYLSKHRFCAECKTKVHRAYELLVEEKEPEKEKGYVSALYSGIKRCLLDKHLHLQAKTDYIAHLIARAEPELLGNHRERHAKTLEIAQEEVLICLGICIYERLQRISLRLREEENTCQILTAVAVEAMYRKFETTVELKSGVTKLELLYDEITQEEIARQQKKEQKKLKKRKRKERLAVENSCKGIEDSEETEEKCTCEECLLEARDTPTELVSPASCNQYYEPIGNACQSCNVDTKYANRSSPKKFNRKGTTKQKFTTNDCTSSHDCGYASDHNGGCCETISGSSSTSSSPDSSEVACSDGFCNHEKGDCLDIPKADQSGKTHSSLVDMLETCSSDEENTSYIPIEEVMAFKSRRDIPEKRQKLRDDLREKFAQLCVNNPRKQLQQNNKPCQVLN